MRIRLGIPYYLSEISKAIGGRLNTNDCEITHITTDTRESEKGDLFIAIDEGAKYLDDAVSRGSYTLSRYEKASITVNDEVEALLNLATHYAQNLPYILYKIGITGSVGKTTTKEFLKIILGERYRVHANEGNYNNQIGLPMSILAAPPDTQILIMEMGMNHAGEIRRLSGCLRPDIAIITSIGSAHIGNLGSSKAIAEAKLEILSGMNGGNLFVPFRERLLQSCSGRITVAFDDLDADYSIISEGDICSLFSRGEKMFSGFFALPERHHKLSLAFATSIGAYLGLSADELKIGCSQISTENTRQSYIIRKNYQFICDCYNSSYESVIALIDTAKNAVGCGRKSLVLGDILELGCYSEAIHYAVGLNLGSTDFNHLFLVGRFSQYVLKGAIRSGFPISRIHINNEAEDLGTTAKQIEEKCDVGEIIYLKASRGIRLERILNFFE